MVGCKYDFVSHEYCVASSHCLVNVIGSMISLNIVISASKFNLVT